MTTKTLFVYSGAPNTERGKPTVLTTDSKGSMMLYGSGNNVIMRNIKDPLKVDWYTLHTCPVTVARVSPSGYYVASGDVQGNLRIWSVDNEDKTLKLESKPLSGPIRDIAWSPDSLRVVVVGEGKENFGSVLMFDTGSNVGVFIGHSKMILSCDHRPSRPFSVCTGSEDSMVNFYKGPPFKTLDQSNRDVHSKYVNCVRFSPSGEDFASASSDKTVNFYEGKTGKKTSSLDTNGSHTGSILFLGWNPEGKAVVTASADKTVKMWDVESKKLIKTVTIGNEIEDQQVSCLWPQTDVAISLSLNGTLNFINPKDDSTTPVHLIHGHNTPIYKLVFNQKTGHFYTCTSESICVEWEYGKTNSRLAKGKVEKKTINSMSVAGKNLVVTTLDSHVIFVDGEKFVFEEVAKLSGCPNDLTSSVDGEYTYVACHNGIQMIKNKKLVGFTQTKYEPTCISLSLDEKTLYVGCADKKIRHFEIKSDSVSELKVFPEGKHNSKITTIKVSPDGKFVAAGDMKEVIVWDTSDYSVKYNQLVYHTSTITEVAWSPDSTLLATASLDGNVVVMDLENKKRASTKAHKGGVKSVAFVDSSSCISTGGDLRIVSFSFTLN